MREKKTTLDLISVSLTLIIKYSLHKMTFCKLAPKEISVNNERVLENINQINDSEIKLYISLIILFLNV